MAHYEQRSRTQPGKAMVVAMSRDICARLHSAIVALRPGWHSTDYRRGAIKVVMTAAATAAEHLQPHHTSKQKKKHLEKRFKDPADPLRVVMVRDMWLTGFDAPCMATMSIDKPMKGVNLAQAIARVNRVFQDKPGGLVVDYIGIAPQLKEALAIYTAARGKGKPTLDAGEAVQILKEQLQVAKDILHPVDWRGFRARGKALELVPDCLDHVLESADRKQRFCDTVLKVTRAFALCSTTDASATRAEEVAFLQAVRAPLLKRDNPVLAGEGADYRLQLLLSEALVAEGVSDIFTIAGLQHPDISILSDQFLKEIGAIPQQNLAVELLRQLITDEIRVKFKTSNVKQRRFSEMLAATLKKHANRSIEAAQVIEELIAMAKRMREDLERGVALGLTTAEQSFYDALADNRSAQELMGEEVLAAMARELARMLRQDATIDWQFKGNVRAKLRLKIRTLLKRYKYPPDQQATAVGTVLEQAETLGEELAKN